jgi:2-polyprenyl-3-methyl-5-hydroxy-6-metoxy-1,4-benzoquinol methylase
MALLRPSIVLVIDVQETAKIIEPNSLMIPEVVERLLNINRDFYRQFAASFAETRDQPQPGFFRLAPFLPGAKNNVLDIGCGEGRFGRFLSSQGALARYTGLDFSEELLYRAQNQVKGEYFIRDFSHSDWHNDLKIYDVVACLATLQHIPDAQRRVEFLSQMTKLLKPDGRIFLSSWQFLSSSRQRRKIIPWEEIGLTTEDVEPDDYLMSWQRDGRGMRYVSYINISSLETLAHGAGLALEHTFRSDGREGDLNLYAVLKII